MENRSAVFIRRFLLFVAYTNISAAASSTFGLEGGGTDARPSPPVRDSRRPGGGGGGGAVTTRGRPQLSDSMRAILTGDLRAPFLLPAARRTRFTDDDEDGRGTRHQRSQGQGESFAERRLFRTTTTIPSRKARRRHSSRDCWKQLDVNIDLCLSDYERMLRNATLKNKQQLGAAIRTEFCR